MKVIVTGCTGLVGSALLRECVANPRITHIYALTRRPLPTTDAAAAAVASSPKVTVVLHDDFASYPPELVAKLEEAEGLFWAIGGRVSKFAGDVTKARLANVDYPLAATKAFLDAGLGKVGEGGKKTFRMVFCSGKYTEWDQDKKLSFMADSRKQKGLIEKGLSEIADSREGKADPEFDVWFVRPGDITPPGAFIGRRLVARISDGIDVDRLASAMAKILLDGSETRILEGTNLYKFAP